MERDLGERELANMDYRSSEDSWRECEPPTPTPPLPARTRGRKSQALIYIYFLLIYWGQPGSKH